MYLKYDKVTTIPNHYLFLPGGGDTTDARDDSPPAQSGF